MSANSTQDPQIHVSVVIITHNPSLTDLQQLTPLFNAVGYVCLVDNASDPNIIEGMRQWIQGSSWTLIENKKNLGIGAALNQGAHASIEAGCTWCLTLDQDSKPHVDMLDQLLGNVSGEAIKQKTALVAPQIIDIDVGRRAPFLRKRWGPIYERRRCNNCDLDDVTTVITSGALLDLEIFQTLGGFREDFFIDYVDTEYCLRSLLQGFQIRAVCKAKLDHHLGKRSRWALGPMRLFPTHHPPERWYTLGRNRIAMLRLYAAKIPHWLSYEMVAAAYILLRMLLTEKQRLAKLRALWQGTLDGIRGLMGVPPWAAESEEGKP